MFIGFKRNILKKNFIIFFTLSAPKPIQSSIRNVCVSEALCPVPYNNEVVKETLEDRSTHAKRFSGLEYVGSIFFSKIAKERVQRISLVGKTFQKIYLF